MPRLRDRGHHLRQVDDPRDPGPRRGPEPLLRARALARGDQSAHPLPAPARAGGAGDRGAPHVPRGAAARGVFADAEGRGARAADRGHAPLRARVARSGRLRGHAGRRPRAGRSVGPPHGLASNPRFMRNRVLHDALRDFALESASLLTDELRDGAEVEFDVIEDGVAGRGGPALYRYKPRIEAFIGERWERLRELPACAVAAGELGAGATMWLRVNGLRGEQAEPALRAMLERLYEDATSFGFPEERFERLYQEVEVTLYHSAVHARVVAPLRGAAMAAERVHLGGGVALVRGDLADAPPEAVWPDPLEDGLGGEPAVLCVLERDAPAGDGIPAAEAAERFRTLVTALRLWAPGAVGVGAPAWRRADEGRWQPLPLGVGGDIGGGEGWYLPAGEEEGLAEFFAAVDAADPPRTVAWALGRFEMGCARGKDAEALSDYLLALRALLDATSDAGEASP